MLDLLGGPNPKFYSYFVETERWFVRLVEIEESLGEMGQLRKNYKSGYDSRYFIPRSVGAHIEDDHIPFMKLGNRQLLNHIDNHPINLYLYL